MFTNRKNQYNVHNTHDNYIFSEISEIHTPKTRYPGQQKDNSKICIEP